MNDTEKPTMNRPTPDVTKDHIHPSTTSVPPSPTTPSINTTTPTPASTPDPQIPPLRLTLLITSLALGLFLSLLDATIVATAMYTIGNDLHSLPSITWIALAYTLADMGFATTVAALADVLGRENVYTAALVVFAVASIGAGFVGSINGLIAARAVQGLGGSGLYSLCFVILGDVVPGHLRRWIGVLAGIVIAMTGVLGPVLGGVITRDASWRWIFWINPPIALLVLIMFRLSYPSKDQMRPMPKRSIRELDFLGCFLLVAASVLVVFAFQETGLAGNIWGTALFFAPLVVGCCLFVALFGWQYLIHRRWPKTIAAVFPVRLLKNRLYMAGTVCTLCTGFVFLSLIFSLPLRLQIVNGKNALTSGIALLPLLGSSAFGSFVAGFVNAKQDRWCASLVVGACVMTIGTGLLSTIDNEPQLQHKTYGFEVFVGFGSGLTVACVTVMDNLVAELRDTGIGLGIISQARLLGGSLGIAASTAIVAVHQRTLLGDSLGHSGIESSVQTLTPLEQQAVRQAYSDGFKETMWVCTAISGASIVAALCAYHSKRWDVAERRGEQFRQEHERQRNLEEKRSEV